MAQTIALEGIISCSVFHFHEDGLIFRFHELRHTRAMHLYIAGMPLEMVAQWLGHSQMETSLIYANATTEMKQAAVKKISSKENSVFRDDEKFKYEDNDDIIKQLYGLI